MRAVCARESAQETGAVIVKHKLCIVQPLLGDVRKREEGQAGRRKLNLGVCKKRKGQSPHCLKIRYKHEKGTKKIYCNIVITGLQVERVKLCKG